MWIKNRKITDFIRRLNITNDKHTVSIIISVKEDGIKNIAIFDKDDIVDVNILGGPDLNSMRNACKNKPAVNINDYINSVKLIDNKDTALNVRRIKLGESNISYFIKDNNNPLVVGISDMWGRIKITIDGEADVYIDGVTEFKCNLRNIKELYPIGFYEVIRKYEDFLRDLEADEYEIDLNIPGMYTPTLYFKKDAYKNNKSVTLRIDTLKERYLNDINLYEEDGLVLTDEVKRELNDSYKNLIETIKSLGFEFRYSHDQDLGCFWGWSDIIMKVSDLNEDVLNRIVDIVKAHEKVLRKYQ